MFQVWTTLAWGRRLKQCDYANLFQYGMWLRASMTRKGSVVRRGTSRNVWVVERKLHKTDKHSNGDSLIGMCEDSVLLNFEGQGDHAYEISG